MKRSILIILTSVCIFWSIRESSASFKGFNYKDITQVYDKIKLEDLVYDINCEDDKCYYDKKEVLYDIKYNHSVGKQNVKLTLVYDNYSYTKEFDVLVLDNISPTINLTEEEINIKYKEEFNPLDYILNITDNFDEDLINKVVVDNKVNINKTGTYEVVYTVSDILIMLLVKF